MKNIIIRNAEKADLESINRIMVQAQSVHVNLRPDLFKNIDTMYTEDEFLQVLNRDIVLVAEAEKIVSGVVILNVFTIRSPAHKTRKCLYIDSMAVDETYRGKGIGTKLLDEVKFIAKEKECDSIELQVYSTNVNVVQMYRNFGFSDRAIRMEMDV